MKKVLLLLALLFAFLGGKKTAKTSAVLTLAATIVALTPPILFSLLKTCLNTVYESQSPAKVGSAIFHKQRGFLDTDITLSVRDFSLCGSTPIEIEAVGDWGGQGIQPHRAVWSRDGTVLAVALYGDGAWSVVYDFLAHGEGVPPGLSRQHRSKAIKSLLTKRGGEGHTILSDGINLDQVARSVMPWENYP